MLEFTVYPGGTRRIVTFSFDDGPENDARLIGLFDRYGVRGTFHLIGSRYAGLDEAGRQAVRQRYAGHEISAHTCSHGWMDRMPRSSVTREVLEGRANLEAITGAPVLGMSYPLGPYDSYDTETLRACGIVYNRTARSTNDFRMPADFLQWNPTCHFSAAEDCRDRFLTYLASPVRAPLFYIWGHSYELDTEEKWDRMEALIRSLSGRDTVWYATSLEIWAYVRAQQQLQVSVDEHHLYNPSAIPVWVEKDRQAVYCVPAGSEISV